MYRGPKKGKTEKAPKREINRLKWLVISERTFVKPSNFFRIELLRDGKNYPVSDKYILDLKNGGKMTKTEMKQWLQVHMAAGIGPKRFRLLLDTFGTPERIINASLSELKGIPGFGSATSLQVHEGLRCVDPETELAAAEKAGVEILTLHDPRYPKLLATCPDPPALLYIKGELKEQDQLSLAVVGTRNPSHYGSDQAYRLSFLLAQTGITVVSGLARGIDGRAHRGALLAKGRTIAVLGCGLATIYPPEHTELADQIVREGGAIISEYPMNFQPQAGNFPARNRIVAGMTLGTLVVEAPFQSGALITATLAIEYNREVFALPGPVDFPNFQGCHQFIKTGKAKLVTSLEDILDELGQVGSILKSENTSPEKGPDKNDGLGDLLKAALTDPEKAIWDFLGHGPNDTDTICQLTNLPPAGVSAALTTLQIKGLVKTLPGNQFVRR
jgi:DNA processing protein